MITSLASTFQSQVKTWLFSFKLVTSEAIVYYMPVHTRMNLGGLSKVDWRHTASCRDEDPELFFPIGNEGPAEDQIREALQICAKCPVAAECLEWALGSGQDDGIWGGMTAGERRAYKRREARIRRQGVHTT